MELIVKDVKKSFDTNEVLKGASFKFEKGKIYALLGRNGSGKTTLFDLISSKKTMDEGRVYLWDGQNEIELESKDIFYMVANPTLPNFLTGREFLKLFIDVNEDRVRETRSLDELFDWIDFDVKERDHLIQTYSLGTKNKIQMLMFILLKPLLILMDEPLTSLDVVVQLQIKKMLKEIEKDHIIIFSTHILQLATDICEEVVIISGGKLYHLPYEKLDNEAFEEKIINILSKDSKEGSNILLEEILEEDNA